MKSFNLFVVFLIYNQLLFSQMADCEKLSSFILEKEKQIHNLNLRDPDFIPLHYLKSKDIIKEFEKFNAKKNSLSNDCITIEFSEFLNKFDELFILVQTKSDSLAALSKSVHLLFYEKALFEFQLKNEDEGEYLLFRSLQYNPTFPDAILLKLNKLLEKNHYDECLSLLNKLYYETQMDRMQEMKAIEFTDKFYDKLYKTGDSLAKNENAADALKLFEILEVFCLNLPASYCNDDYFHGILRSKSGIYDSYLRIAQVAEKRGIHNIAEHFYQYAKQYLNENDYLDNYVKDGNNVRENEIVEKELNVQKKDNTDDQKNKVVETELNIREIKVKYDYLVIKALGFSIKEQFSESYELFLEAQKLEECQCFEKDFRVSLMLKELSSLLY